MTKIYTSEEFEQMLADGSFAAAPKPVLVQDGITPEKIRAKWEQWSKDTCNQHSLGFVNI